jgi:iron complex transport system ATP-binding protein
MLRVENLSVNILKHIRFSLKEGEHLTILGANGSGKTTLAKAVCGLIASDAVTVGSRALCSLSPAERTETLNFIPAKLDLYDEYLSVRDYLALNAPSDEGAIEAVLEELGLAHLHESLCARLSSGESTLLMVAGAMLRQARYTLFDEPTANLDAANSIRLYRLLMRSKRFEHRILITHDLNLAYALGADILYLEQGEERFFGSCEAFFAPEHLERCFGGSVSRSGSHFTVNYR